MPGLKIGVAQVDYTPRVGLPLMGNFRNEYSARGVHDKLYSKAMVVENKSGEKVALVSMDVCILDRDNVAFMRAHISKTTGMSPGRILIAATHTHSGPAPARLGSLPQSPDAAIKKFLKKAAGVVEAADQCKGKATMRIGYAEETRISFVRRLACRDGKTHMNWEKLDPKFVRKPLGRVDPQVIALEVCEAGRRRAVALNFGLHPAILAGDNWFYSSDFPGYISEAMSKISGRNICTLFFNGCCGNINHIDYSDPLQGRGYQMTQRVGYMLAADTQEALSKSVEIKGDRVAVRGERMRVKRLKISEKVRTWSEDVLRKDKIHKTRGQVDGLPDVFYATIYQDMYRKQNEDDLIELMAIRIGDLGIVGLPGEIFSGFGMEIKRRSPARHTIVIELANDEIGYIPDKIAFSQGGYESSAGSTMYAPGTGERMTRTAIGLLNKLF